eukprot:1185497-Prorocentrum_minimum.AAC.6
MAPWRFSSHDISWTCHQHKIFKAFWNLSENRASIGRRKIATGVVHLHDKETDFSREKVGTKKLCSKGLLFDNPNPPKVAAIFRCFVHY